MIFDNSFRGNHSRVTSFMGLLLGIILHAHGKDLLRHIVCIITVTYRYQCNKCRLGAIILFMERIESHPSPWKDRILKSALLAVVLGTLALFLAQHQHDPVQSSLLMVFVACVMVSFLFFPQGPFAGPFWKLVTGVNLFYLLCLLLAASRTREETMELIVRHVDPSLKLMDYDEVSYAQDCRIVNHDSPTPYASLYHACFDIFALAHFVGWFCKTLICRDLKLILFASASFEVIEYSLRDVLNNFKECWWDHVLIDFFGCNLLGIICAFFVIDKLGLDRYRWSLRDAPLQHSHWQNFKRFWTNWDVSGLQTRAFATLRPYLKMLGLLVVFMVNDLMVFFLKYIYHIPPPHLLCLLRLCLPGLLAISAVKDYYDFMRFRAKFRKASLLLFTAIISTEIYITFTHGRNEFSHAFVDTTGKWMLVGLLVIFLVFFVKIAVSDVLRKLRERRMGKEALIAMQREAEKTGCMEIELEMAKEE